MSPIKVMDVDNLASVVKKLEESFKAAKKDGHTKGIKVKPKACKKAQETVNSLDHMGLKPTKQKKVKKKKVTSKLAVSKIVEHLKPGRKSAKEKTLTDPVAQDVEVLKPSKVLQINSFLSDCIKQQKELSARKLLGTPTRNRMSNANNTQKKNLVVPRH